MNKKSLLITKLFFLMNQFDYFKSNNDFNNMLLITSQMRSFHGKMIHKLFHLNTKVCEKEKNDEVKNSTYYQISIYTSIVNKIERAIMDNERVIEEYSKQNNNTLVYPMSLIPMVASIETDNIGNNIMFGGGGVDDVFKGIGKYDEKKPTIALFYTTWCGFSQQFLPIWEEFTMKMKNKNVNVVKIDADQYREFSKSMGIDGYPTVKYINGDNIYTFNDNRTVENLEKFIKESNKKIEK